MIVLKFGGTSVGDPESLRRAIEIVESVQDRSPVVVVSALGGVTNRLVEAAEAAAAGDRDAARNAAADIRTRHEEIAFELVMQKADFLESFTAQLNRHIDEISIILEGTALLREVTPRGRDKIVAIGEKLSSVLFAYTMRTKKLKGVPVDSEEVVVTDECFGAANPLMAETREAASRVVVPELERGHVPVMGGYIGRSKSGATTTLGRGGSDYTAAIIGAALDAEEIQIWTDVDGMMTTDPRIIPAARVIGRISYEEAAELAYFGAKVLHPKTVAPAVARGIAIRVKNTHNPEAPGTLISAEGTGARGRARAIALKKGITVIDLTAAEMLGSSGMLARMFAVFDRLAVPIDVISTSEVSISVTMEDPERVERVMEELRPLGVVEARPNQAVIGIIGNDLLGDPRTASRIFDALADVPVTMLSLSSSGINLNVVVAERDADRALRQIHASIFEGDTP
jgi:aspartate kinase